MTAPVAITAAALANCQGATSEAALHGAFAGREAFVAAEAFCALPFATVLGVLPEVEAQAPWELACTPTRVARCAWASARQLAPAVGRAVARWGAARVAYLFASSTGGLEESERMLAPRPELARSSSIYQYADHVVDATSVALAAALGVRGPRFALSTACSSSLKAVALAMRLIETGVCDAAVVGAADSLCRTTIFGFHSLGLLAPTATRPFSRERAGLTLGEGSAYVVLERAPKGGSAEAALAFVTGHGEASDSYHHTSPHPEGRSAAACMRQALAGATLVPEAIDGVSAHGTGTKANDASEAAAIREVFGRAVPVTASKSLTGHTLGSAGLTSLVLAVESLRRQQLPPSARVSPVDEALGLAMVEQPTSAPLRHLMVNAFGFGGSNASAVISAPGEVRL